MFGSDCFYVHPEPTELTYKLGKDILDMKNTIDTILSTLAQSKIKLKRLEEKIKKLEQEYAVTLSNENKCEVCKPKASSTTSHETRNHKQEVMRSSSHEIFLDVPIVNEQRENRKEIEISDYHDSAEDIYHLKRQLKIKHSHIPLHSLPTSLPSTPLEFIQKSVLPSLCQHNK